MWVCLKINKANEMDVSDPLPVGVGLSVLYSSEPAVLLLLAYELNAKFNSIILLL